MTGTQFDDPNREAVGLEPAWAEGGGGTDTSGGGGPTGLDAMTKAELLEHAEGLGLELSGESTKADIRKAIDEA